MQNRQIADLNDHQAHELLPKKAYFFGLKTKKVFNIVQRISIFLKEEQASVQLQWKPLDTITFGRRNDKNKQYQLGILSADLFQCGNINSETLSSFQVN